MFERCMSAVFDWYTRRRLPLNPSNETIWFGSSCNLDRLTDTDFTIYLDQVTIHPTDCDLGVLLDSSLSVRQHIAKIASTCFFYLRRLRKLRLLILKVSKLRCH